jgi:hypothetical protein
VVVLFIAVLAGVKNFEVPMADVYSAFQAAMACCWSRRHGTASLQVHPTSAG